MYVMYVSSNFCDFLGASYADFEINLRGSTELISNGIYCLGSSVNNGVTLRDLYNQGFRVVVRTTYEGYNPSVYIMDESPSKLLDYCNLSHKALINRAAKALNMPELVNNIPKKTQSEENKEDYSKAKITPGICLLMSILNTCPKVTVTKPKLTSVKAYMREVKQKLRKLHEFEEIEALMDKAIEDISWLNLSLNDSNSLTEEYYYASTRVQYRALCLMQSFRTPFRSCQHIDLEDLGSAKITELLYEDDASWTSVLDGVVTEDYCTEQHLDYNSVDRFFQLGDEGYVSKRFNLYHSSDGSCSFDNFYNTSARCKMVIGNVSVEGVNRTYNDMEFHSYVNGIYKRGQLELI